MVDLLWLISPVARCSSTRQSTFVTATLHTDLCVMITSFQVHCMSINMCLPSWRTNKLQAARSGVVENVLNLLKWLLCSLREKEEHMKEHSKTEDAKDDIYFPANVGESRWDKVCQGETRLLSTMCKCATLHTTYLNAQFELVASPTAFPLTRKGYNSGG